MKQTINTKASNFHKGIHEFKKEYQPQMHLVEDRNDEPLMDFHCIPDNWRNLVNY